MANFIYTMISRECKKSLEDGAEKYKRYFLYISIYQNYRNDVNQLLIDNGCADVIC